MENLVTDKRWNTGRGSSDPKLRMPYRPPSRADISQAKTRKSYDIGSRSDMGVPNEDLNSGFGRYSKSNSRPMPKSSQGQSRPKRDSFGRDELDMLSQDSQHDSDETTKVSRLDKDKNEALHPGLHTQLAIKGLNFKKKNSSNTSGSQSSQNASQSRLASKKENQHSRSNSQEPTSPKRHHSTTNLESLRPLSPLGKGGPDRSGSQRVLELTDEEAPKPKPRIKPRPLHSRKPSANQQRLSPEIPIIISPAGKKDDSSKWPPTSTITIREPNYGRNKTPSSSDSKAQSKVTVTKRRPAPFPLNTSPQRPSHHSDKRRRDVREGSKSLEVVSPGPRKSKGAERSTRGKKANVQKRGTNNVVMSDEEGEEQEQEEQEQEEIGKKKPAKRKQIKKPVVQPFPMSTQYIEGIGPGRAQSPSASSRMSISSNDDNERASNTEADRSPWGGDEDTITMSAVDHKTLCPYCDKQLPTSPTPLLQQLLKTAEKKSKPEPRPWNRFGRKAPFTEYINLCQQHEFEVEILPEAEKKGWPKSIDWVALGERVKAMKTDLQFLIDNPLIEYDRTCSDKHRPRDSCIFWKEILAEVKAKGVKVVAGFQGQFASFEKVQLGYYGELGSVIINQILFDLFPITKISPESVAPLTPIEFIQKVLVPEVGARLIRQDRRFDDSEDGIKQAVEILRESSKYGVAMFPADDREEGEDKTCGGDAGVADRIIMARAEKRRKELEAEEGDEAEVEDPPSEMDVGKPKGRSKKPRKGKERERERHSSPEPPRPRPKPRPKAKAKSTTTNSWFTDDDPGHATDSTLGWGSTAEDPPSSDRKRPRDTDDDFEDMRNLNLREGTPDSAKRRKVYDVGEATNTRPIKVTSPSRSSIPRPRPIRKPVAPPEEPEQVINTLRSRSRASFIRSDTEDSESAAGWNYRQRPQRKTVAATASKPATRKSTEADIDLCSDSDDMPTTKTPKPPSKIEVERDMSDAEQHEVLALLVEDTPRPNRQLGHEKTILIDMDQAEEPDTAGSKVISDLPPLARARMRLGGRIASESSVTEKRPLKRTNTEDEFRWLLSDTSQSSLT